MVEKEFGFPKTSKHSLPPEDLKPKISYNTHLNIIMMMVMVMVTMMLMALTMMVMMFFGGLLQLGRRWVAEQTTSLCPQSS